MSKLTINAEKLRTLLKEILKLEGITGTDIVTSYIGMLFQGSFTQEPEQKWVPKTGEKVFIIMFHKHKEEIQEISYYDNLMYILNSNMIHQTRESAEKFLADYKAWLASRQD